MSLSSLNIVAKTATKQLARAILQRDVDGMRDAFDNGARLDMLEVVMPGEDDVFHHPLEAALICALPLKGVQLLVEKGARVGSMEDGVAFVHGIFKGLPPQVLQHWPDANAIYTYLTTDPVANSEPLSTPPSLSAKEVVQRVQDSSKEMLEQSKNAVGQTKSWLSSKFKKS